MVAKNNTSIADIYISLSLPVSSINALAFHHPNSCPVLSSLLGFSGSFFTLILNSSGACVVYPAQVAALITRAHVSAASTAGPTDVLPELVRCLERALRPSVKMLRRRSRILRDTILHQIKPICSGTSHNHPYTRVSSVEQSLERERDLTLVYKPFGPLRTDICLCPGRKSDRQLWPSMYAPT